MCSLHTNCMCVLGFSRTIEWRTISLSLYIHLLPSFFYRYYKNINSNSTESLWYTDNSVREQRRWIECCENCDDDFHRWSLFRRFEGFVINCFCLLARRQFDSSRCIWTNAYSQVRRTALQWLVHVLFFFFFFLYIVMKNPLVKLN